MHVTCNQWNPWICIQLRLLWYYWGEVTYDHHLGEVMRGSWWSMDTMLIDGVIMKSSRERHTKLGTPKWCIRGYSLSYPKHCNIDMGYIFFNNKCILRSFQWRLYIVHIALINWQIKKFLSKFIPKMTRVCILAFLMSFCFQYDVRVVQVDGGEGGG